MAVLNPVFERIAMLRYLMIVGIVILHMPPYVPIDEIGPGAFDFFKAFFQNAAFRATVPVLTMISGYLLFRVSLDQQWMKLARTKLRTIVVPFLVFNLALLACAYLALRFLGIGMSYQLIPFDLKTWSNAAFGLTQSPINYPLNFLRDLIVLMVLAPLFGVVLRKAAWVGLLAVILIFLNNLDGLLILRNLMPISFYVGGMFALRQWNLLALDRYAFPCLMVFVVLCTGVIYFQVANTNYFRFVAPFLIWPAASLLHGTRVGSWLQSQSKYSFFIFVAHAPVVLALSLAHDKIGKALPYPLYWCVAPVIVVALLTTAYRVLMWACPSLFAPAIGAKLPAARPAPSTGLPAGDLERQAES